MGTCLVVEIKEDKLNLLKKENSSLKVQKFDISKHSKIEEFINTASNELGGLDILVNNAGVNVDNLSLRMKEEEWKKANRYKFNFYFFAI